MRGDSGSTGSYSARGATHDLSVQDSSGALMEQKARGSYLPVGLFKANRCINQCFGSGYPRIRVSWSRIQNLNPYFQFGSGSRIYKVEGKYKAWSSTFQKFFLVYIPKFVTEPITEAKISIAVPDPVRVYDAFLTTGSGSVMVFSESRIPDPPRIFLRA